MHHQPEPPQAATDPVTRQALHTRRIEFQGFSRSDGLWDVEGYLLDQKHVLWERPGLPSYQPGDPVHHLKVRVTLDDFLTVVAIESEYPTVPHAVCQSTRDPLQQLVGQRIGKGWRRAIETAMGGTAGCTHLRELMTGLGTGAIQAIGGIRDQRRREKGLPPLLPEGQAPHFIGGCLTWRRDGPTVLRYFPQYAAAPQAGPASPPEKP